MSSCDSDVESEVEEAWLIEECINNAYCLTLSGTGSLFLRQLWRCAATLAGYLRCGPKYLTAETQTRSCSMGKISAPFFVSRVRRYKLPSWQHNQRFISVRPNTVPRPADGQYSQFTFHYHSRSP